MPTNVAGWSVMLLCLSMASAVGGGLYEHLVLTPLWSASPPSSFAIIQPGTVEQAVEVPGRHGAFAWLAG